MEVRLIEPGEWEALRPIFEREGGTMPDPTKSTAVMAFDEKGLAGFWTLQQVYHAGPLWVREDQRGTGLWRALHERLDSLFAPVRGTGYYSFSGEAKVEHIFKKLGYEELPYKLWKRGF